MSHSFICRPCLQRIQQHGRRSFISRTAQLHSEARHASPSANPELSKIRKVEPKNLGPDPYIEWIKRPFHRPGSRAQSVKRVEADAVATPRGSGRRVRKPAPVREAKAVTTSGDLDPWEQELARERVSRYQEYGYVRHHFSKAELDQFADWKDDFIKLMEFTACGASYKIPPGLDWILSRETVEQAISAWDSWTAQKRTERWHILMFSTLWSCPDRALAVLRATTQNFTPPGYAVKDAVHFLAKWQSRLYGQEHTNHASSLCDLLIEFVNETPSNHIRLRQNTIYSICKSVDIDRVESLYHCLVGKGHKLHAHTLLHLASQFAHHQTHRELALQLAIQAIEFNGADLNSKQWSSLCTSILTIKPEDVKKNEDFSAADAFGLLLEHGFVPNMVNYTAVIRSLCLTSQVWTAWEVFQVMRRHHIEPDSVIWSTLLDGGKRALSASTIERVVQGVAAHDAIDVPFLNDLLFSVLHFSEAEARDRQKSRPGAVPAFGPMLHFYAKVFPLAPLQALVPMDLTRYLDASNGMELPADWELPRQLFPALDTAMSAVPEKLNPTGATLGIMFIAYVKSLSQPINLISLYAYFRQLVSNGSPVATNFVREKGTFVYDAVIKALCEHPGMLRAALDIIGDMLKDTLEERNKGTGGSAADAATAPLHPPPSVYTWSILVHGFMFHKEKASGERILTTMRQHGVEPNLVTWNTLVAGYARNQDVNKTVQSLQRLEAAGLEADDYTLRAFSRLVNKEAALRKMEATIDSRKRFQDARAMVMPDATGGLQI
ncbi:Protein Rf1, mitochondrial [Colletotrichum chlorophyti]|uniref:Protein Rf1, mitochondrial n=1 Tax=Colletotrichum chlorophyti TaxID=708187 RepID=A0A1Q8RD93_9PEZI|nr:Protein Rf1, mitochondrial [Colletotrichum chlorophyti]